MNVTKTGRPEKLLRYGRRFARRGRRDRLEKVGVGDRRGDRDRERASTSAKLPCGGSGSRDRSSSVTVPVASNVARAQIRGAGWSDVAPPVLAS